MKQHIRVIRILLFCMVILPACFLAILVFKYSVNLPFWDQWEIAHLFEKISQGNLAFKDLITQHNESRIFFPRLIFIGLAYLTHWDVRYEMVVIFFLACIVSFNLYWLSRSTINGSQTQILLMTLMSNLLIFSPIQYENWLWGFQITIFLSIACVITCISVAYSKLNLKTKFLICLCLCTISTFSSSIGIVSWIVVFPVIAMSELKQKRDRNKVKWLIIGWIVGCALNVILYFYNYRKPIQHPSFNEVFINPEEAMHFFLSFLGSPLGFAKLNVAITLGLLAISLWLLLNIYFLKISKKDPTLLYRIKGWLMIGIYAVISALLSTFGRLGFGVSYSLLSRYTSFSVYLIVSLFYIAVIFVKHLNLRRNFWISKKLISIVSSFLIIVFIFLQIKTSIYAIKKVENLRRERLAGKASLLFINILPKNEGLKEYLYISIENKKDTVNVINKLGFLKSGLLNSNMIKDIKGAIKLGLNYGYFDSLEEINNNTYIASGWAVLPEREEPADAVILAYENSEYESTIFTLAYKKTQRPDLLNIYNNSSYLHSGWKKTFSLSELPRGIIKITAWAFDSNSGKAFKLNRTHIVHNFRL